MGGTPSGWYAPDPARPEQLRYWDGRQWTEHVHTSAPATAGPPHADGPAGTDHREDAGPAAGGVPGWLVSWPAIIAGFLLCLVPGLVLLWLRPSTSLKAKGLTTAAVAGLLVAGMLAEPQPPSADSGPAAAGTAAGQERPASPSSPTEVSPTAAAGSPTPVEVTESPSAGTGSAVPSGAPTAAEGSALAAALALPVKGRAPKTGYDRDQFGSGWVDVDRNGCDTRNDMLRRDLDDEEVSGLCKVLSGSLADPYTGQVIRYERGGSSEVEVDHMVALADAWQKGAQSWPFAKRVAFANDPLHLQSTDAGANRQKGDGDAATWLPPNKAYRCTYVARQVSVKTKYQLWVTQAEQDAMVRVLGACPDQALPEPGPQPTIASNTGGPAPGSTPAPAPQPTPSRSPNPVQLDPQFGTCREANDGGYGPYRQGQDPEYDWYQDRDGDGTVCES